VMRQSEERELALRWQNGRAFAEFSVDFATCAYRLRISAEDGASWKDHTLVGPGNIGETYA
jgi:hypothetical protein